MKTQPFKTPTYKEFQEEVNYKKVKIILLFENIFSFQLATTERKSYLCICLIGIIKTVRFRLSQSKHEKSHRNKSPLFSSIIRLPNRFIYYEKIKLKGRKLPNLLLNRAFSNYFKFHNSIRKDYS